MPNLMNKLPSIPIRNEIYPRWNGFDVLWISLASGVIIFLSSVVILLGHSRGFSLSPLDKGPTIVHSLLLGLLEAFALTISVYLLGMRRHGYQWMAIGFRGISRRWWMGAIFISIIAIPLTGMVSLIVLLLLGLPLKNPQLDYLLPKDFSTLGGMALTILGSTVIPFAEELYFRGVLYPWMRQHMGIWLSALLSGLIFGIAHFDYAVGSAAFMLGVILALAYEYSESLWTPFIIHAIHNGIKISVLYLLVVIGLITFP